LSGSVVIPAGQASATVSVTPLDDSIVEGDETVTVTVNANPKAVLGAASAASVTIHDNEGPVQPRQHLVVVSGGIGATPGQVIDPATQQPLFTFAPFPGFGGPVSVAAGDLTGDGVPDIVAAVALGQAAGTPAHVKVFDGLSGQEVASFFAFDPGVYRGGLAL